jgi:hypothetical protein
MKAYGGVKVFIHSFVTSALDGGEWSGSYPGLLYPPPPGGGGLSPYYLLNRGLGGPYGTLWREEKFLAPFGNGTEMPVLQSMVQ